METAFVNRLDDLRFLKSELSADRQGASLIVLLAPAGFGKSRLTDQLSTEIGGGPALVVVDPFVVGTDVPPLHNGFFVQKCAAALSEAGGTWEDLEAFLKQRRWKTLREKDLSQAILQEAPSRSSVYKAGIDYASRLFGFGRFSVGQITRSDDATAVDLCEDYVGHVLRRHAVVLVVRETQHIDPKSLRLLLTWNSSLGGAHLVFEYTIEDDASRMLSAHQKAFLSASRLNPNYRLRPLRRLDLEAFETFVRQNLRPDYLASAETYGSWRGNLNDLLQARYLAIADKRPLEHDEVAFVLENPVTLMRERVQKLPELQRFMLALVCANVEALDGWSLAQAVASVYPRASRAEVDHAAADLKEVHAMVRATEGAFRLANETVADAISSAPSLRSPLAIAQTALRDHYRGLVESGAYGPLGAAIAIRQIFRLSAVTRDATSLLRATDALTQEVKRSQDQSVYIDIVKGFIAGDGDLAPSDKGRLRDWAAAVAYDVGEWERCVGLLQRPASMDAYSQAMRSCALQEIGEHDSSLAIADEMRRSALTSDERLAGSLIDALVKGCIGRQRESRETLTSLLDDPSHADSPLLGYVHRFFEIVGGYAEVFEHLERSMAVFERAGFRKSRAYSQIAASVILARRGDLKGGRRWAREAEGELAGEIHARHVVLNNLAAIDLLDDEPDCDRCDQRLAAALRASRDDYCDLTILTNMAISSCRSGRTREAMDCADRMLCILRDHDFADRDVYWPACFNLAVIFRQCGRPQDADAALAFPLKNGTPIPVNPTYWRFRYEGGDPDPSLEFLSTRSFHPLYLSHWLIDREGLDLLKPGSRR